LQNSKKKQLETGSVGIMKDNDDDDDDAPKRAPIFKIPEIQSFSSVQANRRLEVEKRFMPNGRAKRSRASTR